MNNFTRILTITSAVVLAGLIAVGLISLMVPAGSAISWSILAIVIVLTLGGLSVWRWGAEQFLSFLRTMTTLGQPYRGLAQVVITISILWLVYNQLTGYLVRSGLGAWESLSVITLFLLPALPGLWYFYQGNIGRGVRIIWIMAMLFLGAWFIQGSFFSPSYTPNRLFDPETGEAQFWVAEEEGEVYFFPLEEEGEKYFSPHTGEKLRVGTQEDIHLLEEKTSSWTDTLKELVPERRETSSAAKKQPPTLTPEEKLEQAPVGTWVQFGPREWRVMAPPAPAWSEVMPEVPGGIKYDLTSQSRSFDTKLNSGKVVRIRKEKVDLGTSDETAKWKFQSPNNEPELITLTW